MEPRNYFVLLQHREDSEYNDFIGRFYHFPKKYLNQLSKENIEFVYYEPKKRGSGVLERGKSARFLKINEK
jgi:hypothetical protein